MKVNIHPSWHEVLEATIENDYFKKLVGFVTQQYTQFPEQIFPASEHVFRAFDLCPFDKLRVVILGQDPYPTRGHAHGLCFSCDSSVHPLPKSLQNIFKELETDLEKKAPTNGDLSHWAKQGVLLLNSILTVQEGKPLSHANQGWELFTDEVIRQINKQKEGVIFVLWGAPAQAKASQVNTKRHVVLKAPHPSPLSAYRGFWGSRPFSRVNEELRKMGEVEIEWIE